MKKTLLSFTLVICSAVLSGCELRMNGSSYDVPWWVVLIVILPIIVFSTIISISVMPNNFWARCSKCYGYFYVKKRVIALSTYSPEDGFDFVTKCPYCNKRTLCRRSYDQDGNNAGK